MYKSASSIVATVLLLAVVEQTLAAPTTGVNQIYNARTDTTYGADDLAIAVAQTEPGQ